MPNNLAAAPSATASPASPAAALLRHNANSLAADIAHAPLLNSRYETLRLLNLDFVALEPALAATSDAVAAARAHAATIHRDAARRRALAPEAAALRASVAHAIERVSGPVQADDAVVIADADHP